MAITGGHSTTIRRSPRPAGPKARAPIKLEKTVDRTLSASAPRINLVFRTITAIQMKSQLPQTMSERRVRHLPPLAPGPSPQIALLPKLTKLVSASRVVRWPNFQTNASADAWPNPTLRDTRSERHRLLA